MTKAADLAVAGGHVQAPGFFITSGTAVASTSGTSIDFTGLPNLGKADYCECLAVYLRMVQAIYKSNLEIQAE
jgi:hypothetical protein